VTPACGAWLILSDTRRLPPKLKRRQVVEPMIGHIKADGLLAGNLVRGEIGYALHAVLCGRGHNPRMIPAHLRMLTIAFVHWLIGLNAIAPVIRLRLMASAI